MWNLPGPWIKSMFTALAGRFLSAVPPGKAREQFYLENRYSFKLLKLKQEFCCRDIGVTSKTPRERCGTWLWRSLGMAFSMNISTPGLTLLSYGLLLFLSFVNLSLLSLWGPTFSTHVAWHSSCSPSPCPSFMSPLSLSTKTTQRDEHL